MGLLGVLGGLAGGIFQGAKKFLSKDSTQSGMFGLGSDMITNRGALRRQRLADAENERRWHMQNAYNTPKEQMARLKDAGLNPNLIYGSGQANTGVAGAIAPSKAAPYNVRNPVPLQAQLLESQIKNIDSITEKNNVDTATKLGLKDPLIRGAGAKADIAAEQALQEAVKTKEITSQQASITKKLQADAAIAIANKKYQEALTDFRLGLIKMNIDPTGNLNTTMLRWITTSIKKAKQDAKNTNPGESWIDKKMKELKG